MVKNWELFLVETGAVELQEPHRRHDKRLASAVAKTPSTSHLALYLELNDLEIEHALALAANHLLVTMYVDGYLE